MTQAVNNPPAMQETQVQSLDQKDPLEKGMATNSSILAWEILWTEKPGGLQFMRLQKSQAIGWKESGSVNPSVMSETLQPHGL